MSDDLSTIFRNIEAKSEASAQPAPQHKTITAGTHPCFECNGTGIYRGVRINQPKSECFACKGKGYFKSSYADRMAARAKAADRKAASKDAAKDAFNEANPGLIDELRAIASWHQFAAAMIQSYEQWGGLTDKQVAASRSSLARVAEKRAERAKDADGKSGEVSIQAIETMFQTAESNGLTRPRFVTGRLVIERAPAHGRNAGALYVKLDGAYSGKIVGGQFMAAREATPEALSLVREIAADPIGSAKAYGRATGRCSCCGRKLTDKVSVANGIGPVCATNWGI